MFKPGHSGNPGGQRRVVKETKQLAADESPESIRALVRVRDESPDPHAVVAAAKIILSYGLGKPVQPVVKTVTHVKRSPRDLSLEELQRYLDGPVQEPEPSGEAH